MQLIGRRIVVIKRRGFDAEVTSEEPVVMVEEEVLTLMFTNKKQSGICKYCIRKHDTNMR